MVQPFQLRCQHRTVCALYDKLWDSC